MQPPRGLTSVGYPDAARLGETLVVESETAQTDELMAALRAVPGARHRVFLAPEYRVMFMSLNKNACTSLKWMMADLSGEDLSSFTSQLRPFVNDEETVHERANWKVSPHIGQLDPETRAGIRPDNGWFVFAVVRDPRVRLFSAWQNKILLENPAMRQWRREDWYPRHPITAQSVVEDFAKFVDLFERDPAHRLRATDAHFRDQAELLVLNAVQYTRIYDISEIRQLREDITAHLRSTGWTGQLYLPNSNNTPLRANAAVFAGGVRERIERMYAADFELFGDRWDFSRTESAAEWSDAELAEAEMHAGYGRRIGEVRDIGISLRKKLEGERARADELEERVRRLRRRLRAANAAADAAKAAPRGGRAGRLLRRLLP